MLSQMKFSSFSLGQLFLRFFFTLMGHGTYTTIIQYLILHNNDFLTMFVLADMAISMSDFDNFNNDLHRDSIFLCFPSLKDVFTRQSR